MECKFCSAQLHEGSKFCVNCGKSLEENEEINVSTDIPMDTEPEKEENPVSVQPVTMQPVNVPKKKKKKIRVAHIEILAGVVIVIIGLLRFMDSGISVSSTSFGADFYTYSYRGIVNCVNLLSQVNGTASWIIIALGVMIIFDGLKGLRRR